MNIEIILKLFISTYIENKELIIFGAGERGIRLAKILKKINCPIKCFYDNNPLKHNIVVEGIECCKSDKYISSKDNCIIVISPINSQDIFEEMQQKYPYIWDTNIVELIETLACNPKAEGYASFFPIGHYYNLYPNIQEVKNKRNLRNLESRALEGIKFQEEEQMALMKKLTMFFDDMPIWQELQDNTESPFRYRYGNSSFSPGDAIGLHCMLRYLKPKRLIEVGSGWSSAVELDTNEFYFNNKIEMTFIEPYPERLYSTLKETDNIKVYEQKLEDIDVNVFQELQAGDILFIDSTHVSKAESDVNYLFFEILPKLNKGVYIHLHDIFYPFEYPMQWIEQGMVWNELYILRSFLQYNDCFEMVYFHNMMEKLHTQIWQEKWMHADKELHGGSFWMKKIR